MNILDIKKRSGSTLVEVILAVFIVGIVTVPAVSVFTRVAANYNRQAELDRANLLARSLAAEIMQADFEDRDETLRTFGLESGEASTTRVDFDDVDDYRNLTEVPPLKKNGNPIPGATGFTRTAEVQYVRFDSGVLSTSADATLTKGFVVVVETPSGKRIEYAGARVLTDVADSLPEVQTSQLNRIEVEFGFGSRPEFGQIEVINKFAQ